TTVAPGPVTSVEPGVTAPVDPTAVTPSQVSPATTPAPSDTSGPTTTSDPTTEPSASVAPQPDADVAPPGDDAGPDEPEVVSREWLSETGLYADIATETLAEGVQGFTPRFQLWTDTAEKRRWVYIPEGTQIDTSDIDEWKFPVGFKLWKEFSRDG